jgi:hypothetical protein
MMAYKNAVRSPPWFCASNVSSPSDLAKRTTYYVRNPSNTGTQDPRLSDVGQFYLALETAATSSFYAGELYIEYDIVLMTPVLEQDSESGSAYSAGGAIATMFPSAAGAGTMVSAGPNPPVTFYSSSTTNSFYISPSVPGLYFVFVSMYATAVTGPDALKMQVSVGSNAVLGTPYATNTSVTSGPDSWVVANIVQFPNVTDSVQISMTAGSTDQLGSFTNISPVVLMFPVADSLYGVPGGTVSVPPMLGPLRALMRALALRDDSTVNSGESRVKTVSFPRETVNSIQTDVAQKSRTSGLGFEKGEDLPKVTKLTHSRSGDLCGHCPHTDW